MSETVEHPGPAAPQSAEQTAWIAKARDAIDLDFILDRLPQSGSIVVAGGFSGHGFKFSILVGDIVADLAMDGETTRPIDRFRCDRDAAGAV